MLHQRYIWNISKNDCNSDQQWLKILDAWNYCLYFKWNEDGKLDISYEKKMIRYQIMYQLYQLYPFQQ